MAEAAVRIVRDGSVVELVIDRPERANALRAADFTAFAELVHEVGGSDTRAVLIRGEGGNFSAGWDLLEADLEALDAERLIREAINPLFRAIRAVPVPVVAAVKGACLGGGFGIAFAADIVVAADDAKFGSPFRALGVVADSGLHHTLRACLGHQRASEMIYLGRTITGREAAECGLINRACAPEEVLPAARALAAEIAAGPTAAFRHSKRILLSHLDYDAVLDAEAVAQGETLTTRDAREGIAAFRQKRRPTFEGF